MGMATGTLLTISASRLDGQAGPPALSGMTNTQADYYRDRADQLRSIASAQKSPEARDDLLQLAAEYDRLAQKSAKHESGGGGERPARRAPVSNPRAETTACRVPFARLQRFRLPPRASLRSPRLCRAPGI